MSSMFEISLEELISILEARYTMNALFISRLSRHFFQKTGVQIGDSILDPKIVHWFLELVAIRLLGNDRSKPLISKDDLSGLAVYLSNGYPLGLDDPEVAAIFMEELQKRVAGFVEEISNPASGKDSYDDYWDWAQAIKSASDKYELSLVGGYDETKLIMVYDEVVRNLYSKEQYVASNLREDQLAAMKERQIDMVRSGHMLIAPQSGPERLDFIKKLDLYIKQIIEPRAEMVIRLIRLTRIEFVCVEAARIYG